MVSVPIIGFENNCIADAFFVLDGGSTIRKLFPPHAAYWFVWGDFGFIVVFASPALGIRFISKEDLSFRVFLL